jgi:HTH-type transcriptional regulator / antitoxin HipB
MRDMKPLWLQTLAQLSNHLRSFRKARGLTQAALGELTGLDQTRIAKIERDPSLVSVRQLLKLLTVLRVRVLLEPLSDKPQADRDRPSEW